MRAIFAVSLLGFGLWTTPGLAQAPRGETAKNPSAFRDPSAPVLQPAASTDASAVRRKQKRKRRVLRTPILSRIEADRDTVERFRARLQRPRGGIGLELYGDLGGNFGLNSPRLANFGQTLARNADIFGGFGAVVDIAPPELFPDGFVSMRIGAHGIQSVSNASRVQNDAGGFLRTTGHHNTTAAMAILGLALRPFGAENPLGPIRFTFDAGLGRAFHNVSVFGPGGNQVIRSNDSSFAWILRGAVIYQVTDSFGLGIFALRLETSGITAYLANGNAFFLGNRTEYAFGLTGRYTFAGTVLEF